MEITNVQSVKNLYTNMRINRLLASAHIMRAIPFSAFCQQIMGGDGFAIGCLLSAIGGSLDLINSPPPVPQKPNRQTTITDSPSTLKLLPVRQEKKKKRKRIVCHHNWNKPLPLKQGRSPSPPPKNQQPSTPSQKPIGNQIIVTTN